MGWRGCLQDSLPSGRIRPADVTTLYFCGAQFLRAGKNQGLAQPQQAPGASFSHSLIRLAGSPIWQPWAPIWQLNHVFFLLLLRLSLWRQCKKTLLFRGGNVGQRSFFCSAQLLRRLNDSGNEDVRGAGPRDLWPSAAQHSLARALRSGQAFQEESRRQVQAASTNSQLAAW